MQSHSYFFALLLALFFALFMQQEQMQEISAQRGPACGDAAPQSLLFVTLSFCNQPQW